MLKGTNGYTISLPIKSLQKHFTEDQFEGNRADGWRKLKQTAVPTIFSHKPERNVRKKPTVRASHATSTQDGNAGE